MKSCITARIYIEISNHDIILSVTFSVKVLSFITEELFEGRLPYMCQKNTLFILRLFIRSFQFRDD